MIRVTPAVEIDEKELRFVFIRASGPGGQNINKVSTAVQLRFNVRKSTGLPCEVKERVLKLAGGRLTENGVILIEARRFRTQARNREDAVQRLVGLLKRASVQPRARRKTMPGGSARAARLSEKKRRGETKRTRQYHPDEWD